MQLFKLCGVKVGFQNERLAQLCKFGKNEKYQFHRCSGKLAVFFAVGKTEDITDHFLDRIFVKNIDVVTLRKNVGESGLSCSKITHNQKKLFHMTLPFYVRFQNGRRRTDCLRPRIDLLTCAACSISAISSSPVKERQRRISTRPMMSIVTARISVVYCTP